MYFDCDATRCVGYNMDVMAVGRKLESSRSNLKTKKIRTIKC